MFDTHCHIQFNAYKNDAEQVIARCRAKGMILNVVGSQKDTSARACEYADKYAEIYATVGLHPIHLFKSHVDESEAKFDSRAEDFNYEFYKKLAQNKKVIAIGECGLDFFHQPEGISKEDLFKKQKETFLAQYNLAQELNLPLVIHVRNAHDEMIELLHSLVIPIRLAEAPAKRAKVEESLSSPPFQGGVRGGLPSSASAPQTTATPLTSPLGKGGIRGVIHCYTSNWQNAQQYLNLGLHLGFTGVITFPPKKTDPKTQEDLLEVVKNCPLDRTLVETDSPYLAPQTYRGQRCEPWMVEEVIKKIAEIKNLSLAEVIEITTKNAMSLFNL